MLETFKNQARHQIRKYPHLRYFAKKAQRNLQSLNPGKSYLDRALECLAEINLNKTPQKRKKPKSSLIEITNACNLNCLMCNTKLSDRPAGLMTPEVFERIIKELQSTGINSAGLHTVGETFVYKELDILLEIAERHDFLPWISTNAQFPERIETLYKRFPKTFCDLRVSIDGATRETFEQIRVGGSFDKVIETLEVIDKLNNGKKFFRIGVTVDAVLNMTTIHEIPLYFKTFKKYIYPESINFRTITGLSPDDKYFKETFPFKHLVRSTVPCHMPFTNQYYTYDGKATMCCRDYNAEIITGDIMSQSALEIWNGKPSEKVREQHLHPETLEINSCKNCFGPYDFVASITNYFIHFIRTKSPSLPGHEFADAVIALWEGMNEALKTQNVPALKEFVSNAFQTTSLGKPPKSSGNLLNQHSNSSNSQ